MDAKIITVGESDLNTDQLFLKTLSEKFHQHILREEKRAQYLHSIGKDVALTNPHANEYQQKKPDCGKHVEQFNLKECRINLPNGIERIIPPYQFMEIGCHNWKCAKCRRTMKITLFNEIAPIIVKYNLQRHFVLTVKGKSYRSTHTVDQSFTETKYAFQLLIKVIKYHYVEKEYKKLVKTMGKEYADQYKDYLNYIAFYRAQRSGYCHIHILIDRYIDLKWLMKKVKKYPMLGNIDLSQNKDATNYIINDFYKDHEWFIPAGQKNYSYSHQIKLQKNICDNTDKLTYVTPHYSQDPKVYNQQRIRFYNKIIRQIENQIIVTEAFDYVTITPRTVPNEILAHQYQDLPTILEVSIDKITESLSEENNHNFHKIQYYTRAEHNPNRIIKRRP